MMARFISTILIHTLEFAKSNMYDETRQKGKACILRERRIYRAVPKFVRPIERFDRDNQARNRHAASHEPSKEDDEKSDFLAIADVELQNAGDRQSEDKDIRCHVKPRLEHGERIHILAQVELFRSCGHAIRRESGLDTEVRDVEEGEEDDGEVAREPEGPVDTEYAEVEEEDGDFDIVDYDRVDDGRRV
jgi:hypothetical protein